MSNAVSGKTDGSEYSGRGAGSRRTQRSYRSSYRSLRLFYFYLAALWGFVIGVAGLAVALALVGSPVGLQPMLVAVLVPFAGFALAGGAVASVAYREARRRR
jgi:hypothetical protein